MSVILERDLKQGQYSWERWRKAALEACDNGTLPLQIDSNILHISRSDEALAVRYSLHILECKVPGASVEVRVSPWGAIKILDGPASDPHNLTPPDVIELNPAVWLRLASGITNWQQEEQAGYMDAIGERDDLSDVLPL